MTESHDTPREREPLGGSDDSREPVPGVDFDPYRFGLPEHPIAPEYLPPGYVPPAGFAASPGDPPRTAPPLPPHLQSQRMAPPAAPHGPREGPYGQPPAWQAYGQPPTGQHGPATKTGTNGFATAGLVLGILSIPAALGVFLTIPFIVLGFVFGGIGLNRAKLTGIGRTAAIAGIACAAVGAVVAIVWGIYVFDTYGDCIDPSLTSAQMDACIDSVSR